MNNKRRIARRRRKKKYIKAYKVSRTTEIIHSDIYIYLHFVHHDCKIINFAQLLALFFSIYTRIIAKLLLYTHLKLGQDKWSLSARCARVNGSLSKLITLFPALITRDYAMGKKRPITMSISRRRRRTKKTIERNGEREKKNKITNKRLRQTAYSLALRVAVFLLYYIMHFEKKKKLKSRGRCREVHLF